MPVAPGTDGGVGRPGANGHGFTRRVEWGGLAPMEPIVADTQRAAKLPGRGRPPGHPAPGEPANGVAAAGDPTQDVRATKSAVFVIKNGVVYKQP